MHHRGGPTETQHRLVQVRQRQIHREQAKLLVLHLQHLDAAVGQALLQAPLQHVVGHGGRQGQGGFLHEKPAIPQIHGIEKGGGLQALLRAEVIAAVIHQHELARLHRRC